MNHFFFQIKIEQNLSLPYPKEVDAFYKFHSFFGVSPIIQKVSARKFLTDTLLNFAELVC